MTLFCASEQSSAWPCEKSIESHRPGNAWNVRERETYYDLEQNASTLDNTLPGIHNVLAIDTGLIQRRLQRSRLL